MRIAQISISHYTFTFPILISHLHIFLPLPSNQAGPKLNQTASQIIGWPCNLKTNVAENSLLFGKLVTGSEVIYLKCELLSVSSWIISSHISFPSDPGGTNCFNHTSPWRPDYTTRNAWTITEIPAHHFPASEPSGSNSEWWMLFFHLPPTWHRHFEDNPGRIRSDLMTQHRS